MAMYYVLLGRARMSRLLGATLFARACAPRDDEGSDPFVSIPVRSNDPNHISQALLRISSKDLTQCYCTRAHRNWELGSQSIQTDSCWADGRGMRALRRGKTCQRPCTPGHASSQRL
eukprot:907739-Rhodomonas_salina.4